MPSAEKPDLSKVLSIKLREGHSIALHALLAARDIYLSGVGGGGRVPYR